MSPEEAALVAAASALLHDVARHDREVAWNYDIARGLTALADGQPETARSVLTQIRRIFENRAPSSSAASLPTKDQTL